MTGSKSNLVTKGNQYIDGLETGGKPGRPRISTDVWLTFFHALSDCGSVREAARVAGVTRTTVYRYRDEDPDFKAAFEHARRLGAEALEDEARRRAFRGWDEPVVYQGRIQQREVVDNETGEVTVEDVTVRRHSDTLLIFLLKGLFPDKYKDRVSADVRDRGALDLDAVDLTKLSTDELELLKNLVKKAGTKGDA